MATTQCPQCYVGLCKVHPLQDSGRRKQGLLDQQKRVNALLSQKIQQQLNYAKNAFGQVGTSKEEIDGYRQKMDKARTKAEKRPGKAVSDEHRGLASSALNGSTMQIMLSTHGGASDDDADAGRTRKRSRKEKKRSKKDKKKKRDKKDKRDKKKKKKKKKSRGASSSPARTVGGDEKKRTRESSDSSSSDSSDDENHDVTKSSNTESKADGPRHEAAQAPKKLKAVDSGSEGSMWKPMNLFGASTGFLAR